MARRGTAEVFGGNVEQSLTCNEPEDVQYSIDTDRERLKKKIKKFITLSLIFL